jgi:hypothetical protein
MAPGVAAGQRNYSPRSIYGHSPRVSLDTTTKSGAQVIAEDADKSEEMFEESA